MRRWAGLDFDGRWTCFTETLLRLRLVVARVGEGDLARWWNTNGQPGHWASQS
jgi:hypothetical protein